MKVQFICLLALFAYSQSACVNGYWAMHTRNTLKDPNFGPFDCLNAGLPCNLASSASAAKKQIKDAWIKAGGKSYKYMAEGYCPSQVSQSNTWQTGNVTWKFSKLKRRLAKKGKKSKKLAKKGKGKGKKSKKLRALGKKKGGKKSKKMGKKSKKSKKGRKLGKKSKKSKKMGKKSKKSKKGRKLGKKGKKAWKKKGKKAGKKGKKSKKGRKLAAPKTQTVKIGNNGRSGEKCAKMPAGHYIRPVCTKANGCRQNKDFANAGDAFAMTMKDGKVCATRTDAKGKGWGMQLAVKVGRIASVRIGSSRSNKRCAKISPGFDCPKKCLKTEVDGLKCRANRDFAGANDAFNLEVKDGQVCATRTDAKGGWGMNLTVNCYGN